MDFSAKSFEVRRRDGELHLAYDKAFPWLCFVDGFCFGLRRLLSNVLAGQQ